MALIVQKFGGTSVGTTERIKAVAGRIAAFKAAGHQLVVVVSAMSGETDRLISLAKEVQSDPDPREFDVVVSTGEQVTIGLLCMALLERGVKARSYTGGQVRILTDSSHTKARIRKIDEERMRADLAEGRLLVIAGFQGDHQESSLGEIRAHALLVDFPDQRLGVRAVGENAHLSPGVAARLDAALEQRHAQQPYGHLLAARHHDVELAPVRVGLDLLGERDEPVGFSTHCRNHDNELMSGGL